MSRIAPLDISRATEAQRAYVSELIATRGTPVSGIFQTMAKVDDIGRGVLAMATGLRRSRILSRRYRELAVLAVGLTTGAAYEVEHHWKSALATGLTQAQLLDIARYETADTLSPEDKSVIRYAVEATRAGTIRPATWAALSFLDEQELLELCITTAWYNCVCKLILSLELETEDWYEKPDIPLDLRQVARALSGAQEATA